jgi:hypothetical protein
MVLPTGMDLGASGASGGPYMMAAAAGLNVLGGLMGASGSAKSGNSAMRIAEYNAQLRERDAKVAEQQAEQRIFMSKVEEGRLREDAVEFIGDQQAAYNASGVVAGTGTALTVALESAQRADEQIRNTAFNAMVDASVFREEATKQRLQAAVVRAEGAATARTKRMQAYGSLLSTASSTAMMFA